MAHGKLHKEEAEGGVNLGIVITPMLDMSFQLLAFFIMTYHPSALEAHIDGKLLPPAKITHAGPAMGAKDDKKKDEVPADTEPDPKETARVIVRAVAPGQTEGKKGEGEPSRILIKLPGAAEPEALTDADTPLDVGLKRLKSKLTELRNGPSGAELTLTIDADPNLRYGYFIQVQDVCKSAKFENVGFAAPLPPGQGP